MLPSTNTLYQTKITRVPDMQVTQADVKTLAQADTEMVMVRPGKNAGTIAFGESESAYLLVPARTAIRWNLLVSIAHCRSEAYRAFVVS